MNGWIRLTPLQEAAALFGPTPRETPYSTTPTITSGAILQVPADVLASMAQPESEAGRLRLVPQPARLVWDTGLRIKEVGTKVGVAGKENCSSARRRTIGLCITRPTRTRIH